MAVSFVFETYTQLAVFPPQTWVVKRELQWIPLFGWGLAAMRPMAIDRSAGHQAVTQVIEQGRDRLDEGKYVEVWHHMDGSWQMMYDIFNSDRPLPAPAADDEALLIEEE